MVGYHVGRKGLAVAVIVVFLGLCIIPMVEASWLNNFSTEKHLSIDTIKKYKTITKPKSRDFDVSLFGEMGENGWYIGCVSFEVNATNGSQIGVIKYKIDGGLWLDYSGPVLICTDGNHSLDVRVIDQYGNPWDFSLEFGIDTTPPTIILQKQIMFVNKIKFIADVSDMASGTWRVEFYLDDEIQIADYDFPFEWVWEGSGTHNVTAKVFDMAGNSASSSMNTPFIHNSGQKTLNHQRSNQLFHSIIFHHYSIFR
jgi:hypothetical protein